MTTSPFDANPAFAKLGEDTRKSVSEAFDAMGEWRKQMADMTDKNSNAVFDRMAEAAKSLGWPTDFVELSRKQMLGASKIQLQTIDQVMDIWEKQLTAFGKLPEMPKVPGMPNFPSFPGFSGPSAGAGGFPGMPDMSSNPMQMWLQAAELWQKNWQQAMNVWSEAQSKMNDKSKY